jgi:phosphotransferase system enzyme I (PtsI)
MPPHQLPEIRRVIRGIHADAARAVAAEAMAMDSAANVSALLERRLREALPDTPPSATAAPSAAREEARR